jgi:hypothetical protein
MLFVPKSCLQLGVAAILLPAIVLANSYADQQITFMPPSASLGSHQPHPNLKIQATNQNGVHC